MALKIRIFRLGRTWTAMRYLLRTLVSNMSALIYVNLMMVIVIYIFAVLGQKFFQTAYQNYYKDNLPQFHFNDFLSSCMMIFRIMCGEWKQPLTQAIKATNVWAIIFFLTVFIVGNLLVRIIIILIFTTEQNYFKLK